MKIAITKLINVYTILTLLALGGYCRLGQATTCYYDSGGTACGPTAGTYYDLCPDFPWNVEITGKGFIDPWIPPIQFFY